eukprot:scpid62549/ scgid17984/ 
MISKGYITLLAAAVLLLVATETHGWGRPAYLKVPDFFATCTSAQGVRSSWFFMPGAPCLWGWGDPELSCRSGAYSHTYSQAKQYCNARGFAVMNFTAYQDAYLDIKGCVDEMLGRVGKSLKQSSVISFWADDAAMPTMRTVVHAHKHGHPSAGHEAINHLDRHFVACSGVWTETKTRSSRVSTIGSATLFLEKAGLACALLGYRLMTGEYLHNRVHQFDLLKGLPHGEYNLDGTAYPWFVYTGTSTRFVNTNVVKKRHFLCHKDCGSHGDLVEDRCQCHAGWGGTSCHLRRDEDSVAACSDKFLEGTSIWMFGPGATGSSANKMKYYPAKRFCEQRGFSLMDWSSYNDNIYAIKPCARQVFSKAIKAKNVTTLSVWTGFSLDRRLAIYHMDANGTDWVTFTSNYNQLLYPACSLQFKSQVTSKAVVASMVQWYITNYETAKQTCNYMGLDLLFDWELSRHYASLQSAFTKVAFPVRNWDQYILEGGQSVVLSDHGALQFRFGKPGLTRTLCAKICVHGTMTSADWGCTCDAGYTGPRCQNLVSESSFVGP